MEKSRSPVERARLEIVYTPKGYRGFESLLLRQNEETPEALSFRSFLCLSTVFLVFPIRSHTVCRGVNRYGKRVKNRVKSGVCRGYFLSPHFLSPSCQFSGRIRTIRLFGRIHGSRSFFFICVIHFLDRSFNQHFQFFVRGFDALL